MSDPSASHPAAPTSEEEAVDSIVRAGPGGAIAVAAVATLIVLAVWFAFYALVFAPRAAGY